MAEVVMLGTACALPTPGQENTYMALVADDQTLLIDCAGSPYRRMLEAGLDPSRLNALILTHSHPDHIYGLPALLMALWLAGRRTPFDVYGPPETCRLASAMFALFNPQDWPGMFALRQHDVTMAPGALVLRTSAFEITAAPVDHMVQAIGLRVVDLRSGQVLAYSGDTEPGPGIGFLAQGAHVLIHESTGDRSGHSSAAQAGKVAQAAGVGRLVLVHYDAGATPPAVIEAEARTTYAGDVHAARDFERLTW